MAALLIIEEPAGELGAQARFDGCGGARQTTVLIVDDSQYARMLLRQLFEEHGLRVVGMAETGGEAVALYAQLQPDIVTFDLVMPDGGGVAGIHNLLYQFPQARIVVISSLRGGPELTAARRLGVVDCVPKPVRWPDVATAFAKASL